MLESARKTYVSVSVIVVLKSTVAVFVTVNVIVVLSMIVVLISIVVAFVTVSVMVILSVIVALDVKL
jgi:hypothetical protein